MITRGDITGNEVGARIGFHCDRGYNQEGAHSMVCMKSGNWSSPPPACVRVACPAPGVEHGVTTPLEQRSAGKFLYGDVINITCQPGYYQVGKREFTCQANGQWRGLMPTCEPNICPEPTFEHGIVTVMNVTGKKSQEKLYTYAMLVGFSCNPGYILTGESQGSCQADGTWSVGLPECRPLSCPELSIPNAFLNSSGGEEYNTFGLTAEVHCEIGFELSGDSNLRCHSTGEWEGSIPTCLPIECPEPVIKNGKFITSSQADGTYTFGDSVQFQCDEGFELIGEAEVLCMPDKTWLLGVPKCDRVRCRTPDLHLPDGFVTVQGLDGDGLVTVEGPGRFKQLCLQNQIEVRM